ncbi:DUF4390 domain-containing protein [Candidatus Neomarinimicrobiota bacterium]
MEQNFFAIISKKVITTVIAIGSMFYSTIDGVNASFTEIDYYSRGQQLYFTTSLINCFTEDLELIFTSGEEIQIYFLYEIVQNENQEIIHSDTLYHSIRYSPVDQLYSIYYSEHQNRFRFESIEKAKSNLVALNEVLITPINKLQNENAYYLKLSAWMGTVKIAGMEERLTLMYYWNSIKPEKKSTIFVKSELQK